MIEVQSKKVSPHIKPYILAYVLALNIGPYVSASYIALYKWGSWKCSRASAELLQSISGTATELIAFSPVSEQPCYRAGCNVSVLLILRAYM